MLRMQKPNRKSLNQIMTKRDISRIISKKDPELLSKLMEYFSDYSEDLSYFIAEKLIDHPDPYVRYSLAETKNTPEKFLKQLTKDHDIDVAHRAQKTLDNIDFDPMMD